MNRDRFTVRWSWVVAGAAFAVGAVAGCGASPGESVGQSSSAITFANDQPAFDYFLGKGLTSFQAAGIVGNLDQESGVDPTAVESGGPGRGIAQWSVGGRWDTDANDNATWYATMQGQSVDSLTLQLDFIWYELTTFSGYGLAALRASTNLSDATIAFETDFEGCGTCDQSTRIMYAENVLAAFGSDSADAGSTSGVDAAVACVVTTTGESGVCIDTSTCAALGGHVSTPGYCPGPPNEQCCTATTTGTGADAGTPPTEDAGAPPTEDAGAGHPTPSADAATGVANEDSGTVGVMVDATTPGSLDGSDGNRRGGDADDGAADAGFGAGSGGCATTPGGGSGGAAWIVGFALVAARRRRRR
jgi:MYXO-CTERM domain-containing protein